MLNTSVLVLNRSYFPMNITTLKRAFCLLVQGAAKVLDEQCRQFDFTSWAELSYLLPFMTKRSVWLGAL